MNINMIQVVQFEVTIDFFFIIQLSPLLYAYYNFSDCDKSVAKFNIDKTGPIFAGSSFALSRKKKYLMRLKPRLSSHTVIDSVFGFSYMIFSFELQVTVVAGQDVSSVNRLNVLVETGWTRKTLATLPAYPTSINNSMLAVL